jgi:hypothetical protein
VNADVPNPANAKVSSPAVRRGRDSDLVVPGLLAAAGAGCVCVVLLLIAGARCTTDPGARGNAWPTDISGYCEASGLSGGLSASDVLVLAGTVFLPLLIAAGGAALSVAARNARVLSASWVTAAVATVAVLAFLLLAAEVTWQGGGGP